MLLGMRTALMSAFALVVVVTTATASEVARAPGAYASLTTVDAAACARACAEDGICMAWALHRDNACHLAAVVPAEADPHAIAAGVANRAPAFLQARIPVLHADAVIHAADAPTSEAPAPTEMRSAVEDDAVLLGGPREGDLRLTLR